MLKKRLVNGTATEKDLRRATTYFNAKKFEIIANNYTLSPETLDRVFKHTPGRAASWNEAKNKIQGLNSFGKQKNLSLKNIITFYTAVRQSYSAETSETRLFFDNVLKTNPNLLQELPNINSFNNTLLITPLPYSWEGLDASFYEKLYDLMTVHSLDYAMPLASNPSTPASVLMSLCSHKYVNVRNLVSRHPNATEAVLKVLPEKEREAALAIIKERELTRTSKAFNATPSALPMVAHFDASEHEADNLRRQKEFMKLNARLAGSQNLALTLLANLSKPIPSILETDLNAATAKTAKMLKFYQDLLTSPFTPQGERALNLAKTQATDAVTAYEEAIDDILSLAEQALSSNNFDEEFESLRVEAKTWTRVDAIEN